VAKLLRGSNSKFRGYYHPHLSRVFTFYFGTVEFHAKPVEQKYESKASKSPRSAGEQMNVVVVFFSHYWLVVNTRGFFYLRPGREPSEDWNNAVATVMVLSATPFASPFRILARARNSIGNDLQDYQALWCCLA
jgi:hypothetical protein